MEALILTVLLTSVPLIFAATGELIAERSGVLNLGVEGMMLMGAVSAFAATSILGNPYMGILAGGVAGAMTAAPEERLPVGRKSTRTVSRRPPGDSLADSRTRGTCFRMWWPLAAAN